MPAPKSGDHYLLLYSASYGAIEARVSPRLSMVQSTGIIALFGDPKLGFVPQTRHQYSTDLHTGHVRSSTYTYT